MTDTATETQVALAVAAPQSPEEELFGAGVQVREQAQMGIHIEVKFDTSRLRRALEAVSLPQLDEAMKTARTAMARAIAMRLAIPPYIRRAQMHGSFAPSISLPVEQAARPAYRPEHWHRVTTDWRAAAAWCTPSRRPVTGQCRCALGNGEEGGDDG